MVYGLSIESIGYSSSMAGLELAYKLLIDNKYLLFFLFVTVEVTVVLICVHCA